ncbi:hypothetical protein TL16_g06660 [Triparma laevis f. inornata]|uniref:Calmodulin n=1 Tax=Triparma laevis f. inornata TaxID=1714386 RepID=A0A9W7AU36_9STRA|nr:hypothetical protein TL16_g06660 [Triparma laevis f. inornata]
MASDGTRWITGLGMSKSIVQGEISVGGRYFDMEKEMADTNAALSAMQEDSNQLGKMASQPTVGELTMVSENHRKQRVYKDKNFGTWLYLEIESCQGLGKADRFGQSDPFVIIKIGDVEISRTRVVHDNANPVWYDECFEFPPAHFDFKKVVFTLEVWDMDTTEVGSFLGLAEFVGEDFQFQTTVQTVTKPLGPSEALKNGVPALPTARPESSFFHRMVSHNDPEEFGFLGVEKGAKGDLESGGEPSIKQEKSAKMSWDTLSKKVQRHGKDLDAYKIPNPDPTRRSRKSDMVYDEFKASKRTRYLAVGIILTYLLIGMVSFSFIFEKWTIIDSLYFSVVTFTTVGYGDLYPGCAYGDEPDYVDKPGSKMFACIFSLLGIAIIGYALQILGQQMVQAQVKALQTSGSSSRPKSTDMDIIINGSDSEEEKDKKLIQMAKKEQEAKSKRERDLIRDRYNKIGKMLIPIAALFIFGSLGKSSAYECGKFFGHLEKWAPVDSLYWCVITAASIGYGEFSPKLQESRALAIVFIPLSVGVISQALAGIVNIFIEEEINRANAKLMGRELTIEDLEQMNTDDDGEVSQLEFVEFMLKTMKKVDQALLDDLHAQFRKMDADNSGSLQKSDLELIAKRKLAVRRKLTLAAYKEQLTKKARNSFNSRRLSSPKMAALVEMK